MDFNFFDGYAPFPRQSSYDALKESENNSTMPSQQSIVYDEVGFTPDDSQIYNNNNNNKNDCNNINNNKSYGNNRFEDKIVMNEK